MRASAERAIRDRATARARERDEGCATEECERDD